MKAFAALYESLDSTTRTSAKVAALAGYFRAAPPADAAWALYFLTGRRLKRHLPARLLVEWTLERTGLPGWLIEECHAATGDLAELVALLLAPSPPDSHAAPAPPLPLHDWIESRIRPLRGRTPGEQRESVLGWFDQLDRAGIFLVVKLLTGELRVGVSERLVVRALADVAGLPVPTIALRLMGPWEPSAGFFEGLVATEGAVADPSRPYPFFLASPLEAEPASLGPASEWQAEWKWDGIRAQLVRRAGEVFLWSRGEELVTDRFPEVRDAAGSLPDGTVLDGEVLAFRAGAPLPFSVLQRRIGRLTLGKKVLAEAPVVYMAYDLLEAGGDDLRGRPLAERRARLEALLFGHAARFPLSPVVEAPSWEVMAGLRAEARGRGVEGLMLKRRASPYRSGRPRGDWWKWKVDPFTIDAVLVYAHPGHGKRASLFTDYTFAVWEGEALLPFAKAYSGLTDDEIAELDRWVRAHTRERFGPVRSVEPSQVFELAFEGLAPSTRHRSGVAVRFPRILRWRRDKPAAEADSLESVRALLASSARPASGPAQSGGPAGRPGGRAPSGRQKVGGDDVSNDSLGDFGENLRLFEE